jgi:fimbrial chaperone protein
MLPGPSVVAQGYQVTPIQVELTPRARSAMVTVRNAGAQPLRLQASAFEWRQDRKGEVLLGRTEEVVVFPALLTIAPGASRNLRVSAVGGAQFGDVERTFRILVEELPNRAGQETPTVQVVTRVSVPVYLEPPRADRRAEIADLRRDGLHVTFSLRNTGNVRIRPEAVRVVARDAAASIVQELPLTAWYVLAGGDRAYEAEIPRDACARIRSVAAEAVQGELKVQAQIPAPDGACGP